VLGISISERRNMLVAEKFMRSLVEKYGKDTVYSDGGTWYPKACKVLKLKHYILSWRKALLKE
jgi:putative transposase